MISPGVTKNIWSVKNGLVRRRNFSIDRLQLYLPLGHPELSGSPIVSKDINAVSCTVTGAVHAPPTSRTFSGDDYISFTSPLAAGDTFTAIAWFKQTTRADSRIFMFNITDGAGTQGMGFGIDTSNQLRVVYDGVVWGNGTTVPDLATWYLGMMTRVADVSNLYINGSASVISTLDNTPQDGGTEIRIGVGSNATIPTYFLKGAVGEVWFYNRALGAGEWAGIYNNTLWRYV